MFYINGAYVKDEEAKISVLDLGLIRGYGVFDFLRTYNGKPFHLQEHLLRLKFSAKQIGLNLPYSVEKIEEIISQLLLKNAYAESNIKILITGGISDDQFLPQERTSLCILVYPVKPYPDEYFEKGISVVTTHLSRSLPMAKSIQYAPAIMALQEGKSFNAKEALYLNIKGEILEATTSNFFGFKGGSLYTCDSDEVLIGITREVILHLAKGLFPVVLKPIHKDEIPTLDEAFISSSGREIMPVTQINGKAVGNGQPGFNTQKLIQLFKEYTQRPSLEPLTISRYSL